jgi:hypothetical protein
MANLITFIAGGISSLVCYWLVRLLFAVNRIRKQSNRELEEFKKQLEATGTGTIKGKFPNGDEYAITGKANEGGYGVEFSVEGQSD